MPSLADQNPALKAFREVKVVGQGAFGKVFSALAPDGRRVAIKMLFGNFSKEVLLRFDREARILAKLKNPHLVQLLGMDLNAQPPYVILEWIDGGSLDQHIDQKVPAHPEKVRRLARDLLRGVDGIHQAGFFHRDIKPANVFLRQDGEALLGDLGMAGTDMASTISRTGAAMGTPRYMPPEVLQGQRWSVAGDLFAIGITLWEYAVGEHPNVLQNGSLTMFLNPTLRLPSLEEAGAYRNPGIEALVSILLEVQAEARPHSALEALDLLGEEDSPDSPAEDAEALRLYEELQAREDTAVFEEERTQAFAPSEVSSAIGRSTAAISARGAASPNTREKLEQTAVGDARASASSTHSLPSSALPRTQAMASAPAEPSEASDLQRLLPRLAAALTIGLFLLGAGWMAARRRALEPKVLESTNQIQTPEARGFPPEYLPSPPRAFFLTPSLIELQWRSPCKAFARGSARTRTGILEIPRGASTRPIRLNLPAPEVGDPYQNLRFELVDSQGESRNSGMGKIPELHSLRESIEIFRSLLNQAQDQEKILFYWALLEGLYRNGELEEFDPDLHLSMQGLEARMKEVL